MAMPDRVRALGLTPSDEARVIVWECMIQNIADSFRVDHAAAQAAAFAIPSNLLPMLDSPQGVAALGGFIIGTLGATNAIPPLPAVH